MWNRRRINTGKANFGINATRINNSNRISIRESRMRDKLCQLSFLSGESEQRLLLSKWYRQVVLILELGNVEPCFD
jgi:N-acetylmuramoyl-L-alanine amidase